jgi:PAS domain S-box-containing protein
MEQKKELKEQPTIDVLSMRRKIAEMEARIAELESLNNEHLRTEVLLRSIIEAEPECVKITSADGIILEMNPAGLSTLEASSPADVIGHSVYEFVCREYWDAYKALHQTAFQGDNADLEFEMIGIRGTRRWLETQAVPLRNEKNEIIAVLSISRDITERKLHEEQLKKSLAEKEILLKEIHHRVKNNLQVISSLLNLQARYIKDEQARELFKESQNRVRSMALIHEKLYQSKDLARIDFAEYIRDLVMNLFSAYRINSDVITPKVDICGVILSVDVAIPCGLIISELVSNSIKYAFSAGREGEILISLLPEGNNGYTLTVSDNGIGFPKDLDIMNTETLGLQLVTTLTDQLQGTIELNTDRGTEFKIKFQC